MAKHLVWGGVAIVCALIGGYTALIIAGYPKQADSLGSAAGITVFGIVIFGFIAWMWND